MYTIKRDGLSSGNYNIKNQNTALDRIELNSVFHLPLPGPKMIWQFGERGYDVSINDFGGRLAEKPPYWNYLDDSNRTDVFKVMAKLNELKQMYEEFTPDDFDYRLAGSTKWYRLSNGNNHVIAVGNFDIVEKTVNINFPVTGKWYNFFEQDSMEISTTNQNFSLTPGEYRLYSSRRFNDPKVITDIDNTALQYDEAMVFPNPATSELYVNTQGNASEIRIYTVTGKLQYLLKPDSSNIESINIESWTPGVYLLQLIQKDKTSTVKFVKH
jgi:hypothetical protein